MNTVEEFATNVAAKLEGSQAQINPALIEIIMQIVMNLVQNCPKNESEIIKAIRNPTRKQRVNFRVSAANACDCCFAQQFKRDSGRIADQLIDDAKSLSDGDLAAIVFDAANPDFVVI